MVAAAAAAADGGLTFFNADLITTLVGFPWEICVKILKPTSSRLFFLVSPEEVLNSRSMSVWCGESGRKQSKYDSDY